MPLRSESWFSRDDIDGFLQRASMRVQGLSEADYRGRPIIGICNNWSEFTRCHLHFNTMVDAIKRGIWQAGGLPREFNTMTMGADLAEPTGITFMHRNLLSMEVEQTVNSYPVDGLVMLGACDETIPGMLMAAASLDVPAVMLPGGPGLNGRWKGEHVGSSTDCHRFLADLRAGEITKEEWRQLESNIERSPGHCTTMGTASTMACLAEALGMAPSGSAAVPAADSRRLAISQEVGRLAVQMVERDMRPSQIITAEALENAVMALSALGGSTNAVVHLLALARRLQLPLTLSDMEAIWGDVPVLANLKPSGEYLMEDFFYAGGMPALMNELAPRLHLGCTTVTGATLGETLRTAPARDKRVIGSLVEPVLGDPAIVVLHGNLAPNGAILKRSAASTELLVHTGRAVVFRGYTDLAHRLDADDTDIGPDDVVVLLGEGPVGSPGMPERGSIGLPKKLLERGIRDMVRISDSRMSGTAYGTAVLHVSPEAARGGPLSVIQTGDMVSLDVPNKRIEALLSDQELKQRLSRAAPVGAATPARGFARLYVEHVLGADEGCDFDFLLPDQARGQASRLTPEGRPHI
jgi:L-arabonate dehydrase